MASKIDLTDITFLIPLRIDSLERLENIVVCTSFLLKYFKTNIIICEADNSNTELLRKALSPEIRTFFVKDLNRSFHRTFYINELVRISTTPFVAIWDTDVLVEPEQIAVSVDNLRKNIYDFIYPYDGRFIDTGVVYRRLFIDRLDIESLFRNRRNTIRRRNQAILRVNPTKDVPHRFNRFRLASYPRNSYRQA